MAYIKNTWATDDIITADKLNNIESGIASQNPQVPTFTDLAVVAKNMTAYAGVWYVVNKSIANSPMSGWYTITVIPTTDPGAGVIKVVSTAYWQGAYITNVGSGTLGAWVRLAENGSVIHNTGDETVSGNKTFTGTINTTGYLKQKRWSTTVSIGGNTIILNRIGDVVFASGKVTTTLTGETTASGTLPTGFRPSANFVMSTNRGITTRSLLFQSNGSVWVPELINVDSYISGTYLAEDTLPTI